MKMFDSHTRIAVMLVTVILLTQTVFAADTYTSRGQIPEPYKWDLTHIYNTPADFEKELAFVEGTLLPKVASYKDKLSDRDNVLACLKARTEAEQTLARIHIYASLFCDMDIGNPEAQRLYGMALNISQKSSEAQSFIGSELLSRDEAEIKAYIKDPGFGDYIRYLDRLLKSRKHVLSHEEEELLSQLVLVSESPLDIFLKLVNVDTKYPPVKDSEGNTVEVTDGNYSKLMENPDRDFRKAVFEARNGEYQKINNTLAATLASHVKVRTFFAKAYNYDSALEASLGFDIPVSVYNNLIDSANKGLSPLHRYRGLRKRLLGVDKLHVYDGNIPLVPDQNADISFEDGKKIVLEALKPLGKDYTAVLEKSFEENWIDVYETPGKRGGAYSEGLFGVHPYVLLNYGGSFNDVSTLAHELGHAVHQYYSGLEQPYDYNEITAFTSEVASTLNEIILQKYMINKAETNAEKLYYIDCLLYIYLNTFYDQARYAEFEKSVYDIVESGNTITAEAINDISVDLMNKYNGPDFETDELSKYVWGSIPHFYYNFYVYQYATSISAANKLATELLENKPGALDKYIKFLKSGSRYDSVTTLANVGVDMTTGQVYDEFVKEVDGLITEMERLLKLEGKL